MIGKRSTVKTTHTVRPGRGLAKLSAFDLQEAGAAMAEAIVRRTQAGRDEDGHRFTKYSERYAREKGVPRGQVDLTKTGGMLSAFDVIAKGTNWVKLGFLTPEAERKAKWNETGKVPRRFRRPSQQMVADAKRRLKHPR